MYACFLIPVTVYTGIIHILNTPSGAVYYYIHSSSHSYIYILPSSFSLLYCFHLSHTDTRSLTHTLGVHVCGKCVETVATLRESTALNWVVGNMLPWQPLFNGPWAEKCFLLSLSLCLFPSHAFFSISRTLGLDCLALTLLYCSPREQIFQLYGELQR